MGDDSGHPGFLPESRDNGCQGLLAFFRIRRWEALNHQDDAIHEWRPKTADQLLPDCFRVAALDTGGRLKVALGVKRERKKRYYGGKHYTSRPEMAHTHETHDVIPNRCKRRDIDTPASIEELQRQSSLAGEDRPSQGSPAWRSESVKLVSSDEVAQFLV